MSVSCVDNTPCYHLDVSFDMVWPSSLRDRLTSLIWEPQTERRLGTVRSRVTCLYTRFTWMDWESSIGTSLGFLTALLSRYGNVSLLLTCLCLLPLYYKKWMKACWLTDWLTDCLTNWPTDRLTNRQIDRSSDSLTSWLTGWPTDWLTDWLTNSWLTVWWADWWTDRLTDDWLTDWLTDWRTHDWLTDWLMDWRMDWRMTDWLINDCLSVCLTERQTDRHSQTDDCFPCRSIDWLMNSLISR